MFTPLWFLPPLLRNPGDKPTAITYLLSTSLASCNLKKDSGVLFDTLCITITNSQLQKKRMLIVIHFNYPRSEIFC